MFKLILDDSRHFPRKVEPYSNVNLSSCVSQLVCAAKGKKIQKEVKLSKLKYWGSIFNVAHVNDEQQRNCRMLPQTQ